MKTILTIIIGISLISNSLYSQISEVKGQFKADYINVDMGLIRIFNDIDDPNPKSASISNFNGNLQLSTFGNPGGTFSILRDGNIIYTGGELYVPNDIGIGVRAITKADTSSAIYGENMATQGTVTKSIGVKGLSNIGAGVSGESNFGYGVKGHSINNAGLYGSSSNYHGVYGSASGNNAGVYGSGGRYGVYGVGNNFGVFGTSILGSGVVGVSELNHGVEGATQETYGNYFDVYAAGPGKDWGRSSSRRGKRNIQNISDPLGKISQLRGVSYDWDQEHGGGRHDIGFIAEEVGAIFPMLVSYEENGIDAIAMDYTKLPALLVEAFNTLRNQYDKQFVEQEQIIQQLMQRVEKLEGGKMSN